MRKISEFKENQEKIKYVREELDKLLEEESKGTACEKGCHYCCFHPIAVSEIEMNDILKDFPRVDKDRLKAQKSLFLDYKEIKYEDRACVFLENGECSIYEKRPIVCRLTHVKSEPKNCHFENDQENVEHLPVLKSSLLVGAYYMGHPEIDLIPNLINHSE